MYLFFDELQRIDAWEDAVNSFRVDFNCDIYNTGSNAYLLSSGYSTYLSGRYVEIKMLPLSLREFLDFYDFSVRETGSALGGTRRQVFDKSGERYDLREVFDAYMRFGGMSGIADSQHPSLPVGSLIRQNGSKIAARGSVRAYTVLRTTIIYI